MKHRLSGIGSALNDEFFRITKRERTLAGFQKWAERDRQPPPRRSGTRWEMIHAKEKAQ